MTSRSHDPHRQSQDLSIYGYLVGAAFLLLIIRSATVMNALITSSMNLHNLMLSAVVKAPVLFFDTNPVGRVLNRFSRDINIMEELLPEAFMMALQEVLYCLGAVILQSVLIPCIILPAIPLMVIFALIGRYYLNPSRDLRRLEAVNRSPVLSHFRDSLDGLVTIRAYKKENTSTEALYRFVCVYLILKYNPLINFPAISLDETCYKLPNQLVRSQLSVASAHFKLKNPSLIGLADTA